MVSELHSAVPFVPEQEKGCEHMVENSGNWQRHILPGCKALAGEENI